MLILCKQLFVGFAISKMIPRVLTDVKRWGLGFRWGWGSSYGYGLGLRLKFTKNHTLLPYWQHKLNPL